ncbi:MAG: Hsp20/alpha crystallin family protein [Myxococcota bacterium]
MASQLTTRTQGSVEEESTRAERTYRPPVDICETDEALLLWADMPGVDESSVEVRLEDSVLSIEGKVSTEAYENRRPLYTEYHVGNYMQRFSLPSEIDADQIRARMVNGVLQLELPKSAQARPRQIQIQTA